MKLSGTTVLPPGVRGRISKLASAGPLLYDSPPTTAMLPLARSMALGYQRGLCTDNDKSTIVTTRCWGSERRNTHLETHGGFIFLPVRVTWYAGRPTWCIES